MGEGNKGQAGPWARCKATGDGVGLPPSRKSWRKDRVSLGGGAEAATEGFLSLNFLIY